MFYACVDSKLSHSGFATIMDDGDPSRQLVRNHFQRLVRLDPSSLAATLGGFAIIKNDPECFARIAEMLVREDGAVGSISLDTFDRATAEKFARLIAARAYSDLAVAIRGMDGFRPVESMAFEFQQTHFIVSGTGFWHVTPDDREKPEKAFDRIEAVLCRVTDPVPG